MTGRTAVVTGAGAGIGYATVLRLARDGWTVAAVDVDPAGVERAVAGLRELGASASGHVLDVRDAAAVDALAAEVGDRTGLLVNNAGVGVAATVPGTTIEDWDATIAVNLTGPFLLCRAFVPLLLAGGGGVVVNVSSVAGVVGLRNRAAYCASKAGVLGLTRALAADHAADGLRVNAICPGTVATEWVDRIVAASEDPEATRRAMHARQLDGRLGQPEEVAAGIAFLASPEARFVNGSAFVMDGGMTAV